MPLQWKQRVGLQQTAATWSSVKQLKHRPTKSFGTRRQTGARRRWNFGLLHQERRDQTFCQESTASSLATWEARPGIGETVVWETTTSVGWRRRSCDMSPSKRTPFLATSLGKAAMTDRGGSGEERAAEE